MTARRRIQRFEVLEQLGSGGAGQVYRARDPELERDVAIKVLAVASAPSELSADDTLDLRSDGPPPRDQLLCEARMMAKLSHPNVLPVYEVGLADGAVFLVMEHIDGSDLTTWLEQPRTTEAILDVFLQAARGLAAAHERGIVHRDIKPDNILIDRDGRVKVADFGLSRLTVRSPAAMVHLNDGRGTPRYMAPELWRGQPATPRSDVFALCLAVVEALGGEPPDVERTLRERGISARLRRLLARGLADDPAARPVVAELAVALAGRSPGWRTWAIAAMATSAAIAAVIAMLPVRLAPEPSLDCEADPARLAARWDAGRLAAVGGVLADRPPVRGLADRIMTDLVARQRAIDASLAGTCQAARTGEITRDQYAIRAACLERRVFALAATVDFLIEHRPSLLKARDRLWVSLTPEECTAMTAPPFAGDPAAAEALWRRYTDSAIYAVPSRYTEHIAVLSELIEAAGKIGETELVARSTRWLAVEQRFAGQLGVADDTIQRAYRIALEIRATPLAAQLLADRAAVAILRDDAIAARSYAELARDLADAPGTPPMIQTRVFLQLGRALSTEGDHRAALGPLRRALDVVTSAGAASTSIGLDIRENLLSALVEIDVQSPGTVDLAIETAELTRELVGERDVQYGIAVHMVAATLSATDDHTRAADYRRKAVEIVDAALPSEHPIRRALRTWLTYDLYNLGDLDAAQAEITQLSAIQANYVRSRWLHQALFGRVAFERGQLDDGLALATQAQEEAISAYGKHHPDTLALRGWMAAMELELGRLDAAARDIAAIEAGYRARPDNHRLRSIRLSGGLAAELAIARGKPRDAEALARRALEAAGELRATHSDRARFHASLGKSLNAQRRWAEAETALAASLALLIGGKARQDDIAAVEIALAVAEAGLGKRGAALARARRARAVLAGFPGQLRARDEADRLLARRLARR